MFGASICFRCIQGCDPELLGGASFLIHIGVGQAISTDLDPMLSSLGPLSMKLGRARPTSARFAAISALMWAGCCQILTNVENLGQNVAHIGLSLPRSGPILATRSTKFSQTRAQTIQNWPEVGRNPPMSAKVA